MVHRKVHTPPFLRNSDDHNAFTLTPTNTRIQTLPYERLRETRTAGYIFADMAMPTCCPLCLGGNFAVYCPSNFPNLEIWDRELKNKGALVFLL